MSGGKSNLFPVRTPGQRVDAERLLSIRMCPESSIVGAVRIDETDLRAVMNVSNRALLRTRSGNGTQQRERDND